MKSLKILLLSVFLVAASNSIKAQGFGIRAGANFSDMNVEHWNTDTKTGFYVGVFKEIPLVKNLFFIQPEIQYSQEGFESNINNVNDVKIDYITFPIMAKIYVLKLLSFETGPQFGFPVSDNLDNYSTNGFVTNWGFGMSINLPFHFSINGRYVTGLSDSLDSFDSKSQVFQVGAAFRF